jgi:hypothetical protein
MTNVLLSKAAHYNGYIVASDNDMGILLLAAIRYSMGRQTYMTTLSWELVVSYNQALTDDQLQKIIYEIQQELNICEGRDTFLGAKTDHQNWQAGVAKLKQILDERKERSDAQTLPDLPGAPSDVQEST